MGAIEMAVGNIFGSYTFNMVILLAVDTFYPAPVLASVSPVHSVSGVAVVVITSLAIIGLLCVGSP
jgi:cation:H+ antiporter